jgi:hypothetical protein
MRVLIYDTAGKLIAVCSRKRPEDYSPDVATPAMRRALRKANEQWPASSTYTPAYRAAQDTLNRQAKALADNLPIAGAAP